MKSSQHAMSYSHKTHKTARAALLLGAVVGAGTLLSSPAQAFSSRSTSHSGTMEGMGVGDVDGDGQYEFAALSRTGSFGAGASRSGWLALYGANGVLRWEVSSGMQMGGYPVFADLNADGAQEIIACDMDTEGACHAYSGSGVQLWQSPALYVPGMVATAPAVANITSDAGLEVVVSSWGGEVVLMSSTGNVLWRNTDAALRGENYFSTPSVADLDHDGSPEIILLGYTLGDVVVLNGATGTTKWMASNLRASYGNYSYSNGVLVTDLDGNRATSELVVAMRGSSSEAVFGFSSTGTQLFRTSIASSLRFQSPVAADLNGDLVRELYVLGGNGALYELSKSGQITRTAQLGSAPWTSPGVADVDADGIMELIVPTASRIVAVDGDLQIKDSYVPTTPGVFPSPVSADIDGDNQVDIFTAGFYDKTLIRLSSPTLASMRWSSIGGGSGHSGESNLGLARGVLPQQVVVLDEEIAAWAGESSTNSQMDQLLGKVVSDLQDAQKRLDAGKKESAFKALEQAVHELLKGVVDLSIATQYVDSLTRSAYSYTANLFNTSSLSASQKASVEALLSAAYDAMEAGSYDAAMTYLRQAVAAMS